MHDTPLTIEPLTNFSREPGRAAMKAALDAVSNQLGGQAACIDCLQSIGVHARRLGKTLL